MDFITSQQHPIETTGSHLIGVVEASYNMIKTAFGEPFEGDGEKTQAEWAIEFEDGTIATIYDWKEYTTPPKMVTEWHIGGFNDNAELRVLEVITGIQDMVKTGTPLEDIPPRIFEPKKITAWSINVRWSDGEIENVDLPDDFRQAHKDVNAYLDQLEDERNA
jgi:hypothetical protein